VVGRLDPGSARGSAPAVGAVLRSAVRRRDLVDVVQFNKQTGEDVVELAGVTVVELRGDGHHTPAVVEDATGQRHTVTSHTVRKRASEA